MTQQAIIRTDTATALTADPDLPREVAGWDAAVSRYLETRKGGPEGNTARTYGRTLRAYKDFALESGLNPWGGDALIAYNRHVNGLDLADDTKAAKLTHVQGFFRWAYIHGASPLTPEMVKGFIHKPRCRQLSPRDILDASEVGAMLEVAKDPREHALIKVMADGGLRVSEAISLKADDVYLAEGKWYLHVRGKGDKSREVEVSEDLAQELLALEETPRRNAGTPLLNMSRTTAFRWVKRIAEKAVVTKDVSPHTLRHTHAHNLRLAGYSLEATSYRLGHFDVRITTRYTRPASWPGLKNCLPCPGLGQKQSHPNSDRGGFSLSGLRTTLIVTVSVDHAPGGVVEDSLVTIVMPDILRSP